MLLLVFTTYSGVSMGNENVILNVGWNSSSLWDLQFVLKNLILVLQGYIEDLGLVLNSEDLTISLFDLRKENLKLLCSKILKYEFAVIRTIAKHLGKFTSIFSTMRYGKPL